MGRRSGRFAPHDSAIYALSMNPPPPYPWTRAFITAVAMLAYVVGAYLAHGLEHDNAIRWCSLVAIICAQHLALDHWTR